ncbi:T9SS type A sorting domain-containing protein [Fulvivirgaceae bacterium LMO-SS25]
MKPIKVIKYNFFKITAWSLVLIVMLTLGSFQSSAQGWNYDFAGKSLTQLVDEGFVHENFNPAADGIVTSNLATYVSTIRTPYFYLGVDDYFTFNGARLNNAAGNGTLDVEIFAEALDGTIVKSINYAMHDASQEDLPEFDFSVLTRGFFRIGIRISYIGNKNSIFATLTAIHSPNLPEQTYTPDQAISAIEVRSNIIPDKMEYLQGEVATFEYKINFDGIDGLREVNTVIYHFVIPVGFQVNDFQIIKRFSEGTNPNARINYTLEDEVVSYDPNTSTMVVENSTTDREFDVIFTTEAVGDGGTYWLETDIESSSPTYVNDDPNDETDPIIIIPFGTQPVELIYFDASADKNFNLLSWATAKEVENDFFAIEKSVDGINFEVIDQVDGNGDYVGTLKYTYEDHNLIPIAYYRLRQVDFNGDFKVYETKRVLRKEVAEASLKLYPNPNNGNNLNLMFAGTGWHSTVFVTVLDAAGKMRYNQEIRYENGFNDKFALEQLDLEPGLYIVQVNSQENIHRSKLIVQGNSR